MKKAGNSRMEHVEWWAKKCRQNMKECQRQVMPFIEAQIEMANDFYKRLAKTKGGMEKIRQLKTQRQKS